MDLEDSDLVEMGFTKGQRMNIIQLIKVRIKSTESMDEFYGIATLYREAKKRTVLVRLKLHLNLFKQLKLPVVNQVNVVLNIYI